MIKTKTYLGSTHFGDLRMKSFVFTEHAYAVQIRTETGGGEYIQAEHASALQDFKADEMKWERGESSETKTTVPELTEQHRIRLKEEELSGLESVHMAESETECAAPGLNTLEPECVTVHSGVSDVHHTHTSLIKTETDLGSTYTGVLIKKESLDLTKLEYVPHLHPDQIKMETDDGGYLKPGHFRDLHNEVDEKESDHMKCESRESSGNDPFMNPVLNGAAADHEVHSESQHCDGEPNQNCKKEEIHDQPIDCGDLHHHCGIKDENNQTRMSRKRANVVSKFKRKRNCAVGSFEDSSDSDEDRVLDTEDLFLRGIDPVVDTEPRRQQKNTCDCFVEQLLITSFCRKSSSEKNNIIERGRPTPALPGLTKTKSSSSSFTRHFQVSTYKKSKWLTGCAKLNKLFCWPCILFLNEKSVWNKKGYDDLGNLHGSMQKHERTQVHIRSVLALKTFESTRVDLQSGEQVKLSIERHNQEVRKNREVLRMLIDAVTFLGSQELALRGHSDVESSINRDNYVELIQLLGRYDERLARRLEKSAVFTGMSDRIQDDLIEAVAMVMRDEIKREVRQAQFVSILLDETTDKSNAAQLSTVLRYVSQDGTVEERFMGFSHESETRDAAALSRHVFDFVDELDCGGKLVAQTYDGAAVTSGDLSGLQARVRKRFPCATFVHCRAHVLNLVLSQACCRNKHCKIFFSTLNELASFFRASAKRTSALDEIVLRSSPEAAPTRWNCTQRLVNNAKENYSSLLQLFSEIRNEPQDWDDDTVLMAGGFLNHFEDEKFRFLLEIFADIFSHTDDLFSVLQIKSEDVGYCAREAKRVTELLEHKRGVFRDVFVRTVESSENPPERCRPSMDTEKEFRQLYTDVFDTVVSLLRTRFGSLEKIKLLELLNLEKFTEYSRTFPETAFTSLKETYGCFFDDVLLHNELSVLYTSPNLAKRNVAELISYMNEIGITEALGEVYKLCCLFLTVPSTTASVERTCSALERVKTFTRNTVGPVRLSGLGLMAIERALLHKLKAGDTFYDDVIECFVKKNRRMDFIYK